MKRSERWEEGACVLEGPDLIDAALEAGFEVEAVYMEKRALGNADCSASIERAQLAGVRVFQLDEGTLFKVADTKSPQPTLKRVPSSSWKTRTPASCARSMDALQSAFPSARFSM